MSEREQTNKEKEREIHLSADREQAQQPLYNTSADGSMSDKGDYGKKGSMQDAYREEEGYFTMDEDEGKDEREDDNEDATA